MNLALFTALLLLPPASGPVDRAEDREKIRAHIDRIFQAFIHKDAAELRATHDENWLGYLEGSPTMIRGVDAYMATTGGFANSGAKLARLEFPTTEIQCYGNTAIIYSTYLYELEQDGKRAPFSGRVTEVFVYRKGQWVNPGWHMDSVK